MNRNLQKVQFSRGDSAQFPLQDLTETTVPFVASQISQLGTFEFKKQLCDRSSVARVDLLDLRRGTLIIKSIPCVQKNLIIIPPITQGYAH